MAREMTALLRRDNPNCVCKQLRPEVVARGQTACITELRPIQGWYLREAMEVGGVLGPIAVGGGKTGIDILTVMVVPNCKLAILLIPPGLKQQLLSDYRVWSQHFQVPNLRGGPGPFVTGRPTIEIFPYSQMSQEKNSVWLKSRVKDMPEGSVIFVADEIHNLKDQDSVRTFRFMSVMDERPDIRLFCHSGSMISRSILDCAHFAAYALKDGSPFPLDRKIAEHWALALDPVVGGAASHAPSLAKLCMPGETRRHGFQRRLIETKGVVATADSRIPTKLEFHTRVPPPIPTSVEDALDMVRAGERPDHEELETALEVSACARQVSAGFYLYWAFPRGEPEELIQEWRRRRKAWGQELRDRLSRRSEFMDSPALLAEAAERYHNGEAGDRPTWESVHWPPWAEIADQVQPVTKVKWLDDWLMRDAAAWALEAPGIVWVANKAVGHRIAKLSGLPYYSDGKADVDAIHAEKGNRSIIASIKAHGEGRNLQYAFSRNLFVQLASDGKINEQTIGRTHRPGQPADTVTVYFYQHTPEYESALETAVEYAKFTYETKGQWQKLLYGQWVD